MTTNNQFAELQKYAKYFASEPPKTPTHKYVSILLLRETKSYAIFTTEGGQQQDIERTKAGLIHSDPVDRLVMFKRKQVAPERRTGKALMRQYGVFPYGLITHNNNFDKVVYGTDAIAQEKAKKQDKVKVDDKDDCYLTAGLCGHCIDCMIYGYAAIEGEGSRSSRIITDSCFSVRPYALIQKGLKFNVIDEKTQTSGTITEYDYTAPEVFLPSVITTVDLTLEEFVYTLINLVRTTRYGKESSRQGFIRNHILGIAFSDVELFSNLEFSQAFYDALEADQGVDLMKGFLSLQDFTRHSSTIIQQLTNELNGRLQIVDSTESLNAVLSDIRNLNRDETELASFLQNLNTQAARFSIELNH